MRMNKNMKKYTHVQKVIGVAITGLVFSAWVYSGIDAFHRSEYVGCFAAFYLISLGSYIAYKSYN